MLRLIFVFLLTALFFLLLNFIYCNLNEAVFGYQVVFTFGIPKLITYQSVPLPLGFVLLASFCSGMLAVALLEAIPSFYKTLEIRSKNKKIKVLEKELKALKEESKKKRAFEGETDKTMMGL